MYTSVSFTFAYECRETNAEKLSRSVLIRMQELFGGTVNVPKIVFYPTGEALRRDLGLPESGRISGRYDPVGDELYIACREENTLIFERVLRHEAAHYYLRHIFGKIPYRLEEGIAAYIEEGALFEGKPAEHINAERLREFRALLRRGRVPDVAEIFLPEQDGVLSSADYAVAWGFVFAMLHNPDPLRQAERRQILRSVLAAGESSETDFYRVFVNAITASEGNLKIWEVNWRRGIWSLKINK